MEPKTIWKEIPIAPNYEVSNIGRVRNVKTGWTFNVNIKGGGYPRVTIRTNKGRKTLGVHTLVLLAFVGERPLGKEANHINGIKNRQQAVQPGVGDRP